MNQQQIDFIKAVQRWLEVEDIDGLPGTKTWDAWTAKTGQQRGNAVIDPARFKAFAPRALPGTLEALQAAANTYGLRGLTLAHWLGQMHVESGGFSTMEESLNYTVEALLSKFGRHRISEADARALGRIDKVVGGKRTVVRKADQVAIANILYGGEFGRKNLGNTQPGDGWKNRGAGFKQLTGEANIKASGYSPEELRTDVRKSALASAQFFITHGCAEPALRDDVKGVTLKVNGGTMGLDDRVAMTAQAKRLVGL